MRERRELPAREVREARWAVRRIPRMHMGGRGDDYS